MVVSWGSVKKFLQAATLKVRATKANSAGKALRFGKVIIRKPQKGGLSGDRAKLSRF